MRFRLLALLAALTLVLAPASPVAAMEEWCEDDPPVVITTPKGNRVVVYVTSGALGVEHLAAVQLARITYTVKPADDGRKTLVIMDVTVPNDAFGTGFPTKSTVSEGPFKTLKIYATATGTSGTRMRLKFKLAVP